jgi:glycine cleavage system transcriptional repressor
MSVNVVLTLTGPDRIGIVEEVTGALLSLDANITTSRMARLGGEFAILMLAGVRRADGVERIERAFADLVSRGYKLSVSSTAEEPGAFSGWLPYRVDVRGADHEGIIHAIAAGLSARGINIESMETGTTPAPVTGAPLFSMTALVVVPPGLADADWMNALAEAGELSGVDVDVEVATS